MFKRLIEHLLETGRLATVIPMLKRCANNYTESATHSAGFTEKIVMQAQNPQRHRFAAVRAKKNVLVSLKALCLLDGILPIYYVHGHQRRSR